QGKSPYLEFHYQQMPALPYLYAAWMKLAGVSWASARLLSVLFSVLLGGLLCRHVLALYHKPALAWLAAVLYASSSLVFAWHTVVKTYAAANLFLFGAYLLACDRPAPRPRFRLFLSGLLLGLAVDTRLCLAAVAPVLLIYIWRSEADPGRSRSALWLFGTGLAAALLPNLFFLWKDPDACIFGNCLYPLTRDHSGLLANLKQKLGVVFLLLNLQPAYDAMGGQFALLCLLVLSAVLLRNRMDPRLRLPFSIGLVLAVICLLPNPTFTQYFCVCVPYWIIVAAGFVEGVTGLSAPHPWIQGFLKRLGGVLLGAYLCYGAVALYKYGFSGVGVAGIETAENAANFRISTVRQVSAEIGRWAGADEPVISSWPGYLVESDCVIQPGMEHQFSILISERISQTLADRLKMISEARLQSLLRAHARRVAVLGNDDLLGDVRRARYRDMLAQNGYRLVRRVERAQIYVWSSQ
ncbi:MAG: glycosyltransferase family 39 protein, partial [Acidobacteria bacterium]|nr:glycosyltransferase family 39 protein [Acidobacteriota bacterium]